MSKPKNKTVNIEQFDRTASYSLEKAVQLVKLFKSENFDESVDLAMNLGVDPRHADQNIRVTTGLPNGTGKTVIILALTMGQKEKEAKDAGADFVGNKEYIEKIKNGWT